MKPDVLKQMADLEKERQEMMKKVSQNPNGPIMMNVPGKSPKQLSNQEVVQLIQEQQQTIQNLNNDRVNMQNNMISMQNQLIQLSITLKKFEEDNNNLKPGLENKDNNETTVINLNDKSENI